MKSINIKKSYGTIDESLSAEPPVNIDNAHHNQHENAPQTTWKRTQNTRKQTSKHHTETRTDQQKQAEPNRFYAEKIFPHLY